MYVFVALSLRTFGGVALSAMLGVMGVIAIWILFYYTDAGWSRWLFVLLWYSSIGVGAGLGSYFAWVDPDSSRPKRLVTLSWMVAMGLAGAWAGYYYKAVLNDDPAPFTGRAVTATAEVWAIVTANAVATSLGVFRQLRSGWL